MQRELNQADFIVYPSRDAASVKSVLGRQAVTPCTGGFTSLADTLSRPLAQELRAAFQTPTALGFVDSVRLRFRILFTAAHVS